MKNIFTTILFIFLSIASLNAQIKVTNGGKVGIGTNNPQNNLHIYGNQFIDSYNTLNYGSALKVKVYNPLACSYHLEYGGRDVFYVSADGWLWTLKGGYFGSDIKLKEDISDIKSPLATIRQMRGVKYKYKENSFIEEKESMYSDSILNGFSNLNNLKVRESMRIGLIAQEVEQIVPEVVKTMPDSTKAIAYTDLIALLIEGIKEQQIQIETLQNLVYSQEQDLIKIKDDVENCCSSNEEDTNLKSGSIDNKDNTGESNNYETAKLYENIPNPFSQNTTIKYEIPTSTISAQIIIHNMEGIELKSFPISTKGAGYITINGTELQAGMYLYTLLINNQIVDTKRMLLTKE